MSDGNAREAGTPDGQAAPDALDDATVRVYVSADAPEWKGTVDQEPGESDAGHAERTEVIRKLFGWRG